MGHTGMSFYGPVRRAFVLALAMQIYRWTHGRWPDLLEPTLLTEKLFCRKFLTRMTAPIVEDKIRTPRFAVLALPVRVTVPEAVAQSKTPEFVNDLDLPAGAYFIKLNRGSGTNVKVEFPLSRDQRRALTRRLRRWLVLRERLQIGEWWNALIEPVYTVERAVTDDAGEQVEDWKFLVIGGRTRLVQNDLNRFRDHRQKFYDRDGNEIGIRVLRDKDTRKLPLPDTFADMVTAAEAIGSHFDLIRVDLFTKQDGTILLGELTIVPGSGATPIQPPEADARLGKFYDLRPGKSYLADRSPLHPYFEQPESAPKRG